MSGRSTRRRAIAFALVVVAFVASTASTVAAPAPMPAATPSASAADWWAGALTIEPGEWTSTPDVTLHLQAPPNDDSHLMIANDASTFVTVPFAATIPWSLIDPAAGGVDADGAKTVTVYYGDGVTWDRWTWTTVNLDRVAPSGADVAGVTIDGTRWSGTVDGLGGGLGDVAAVRSSIDGGATWLPWNDGNVVDIWNAPGAAAWTEGALGIDVQLRDHAGNTSDPISTTAVITDPQFTYFDFGDTLDGVTFEAPHPAITGKPFTIRVHYPAGYTLPANAWCQWIIHWGDDASIRSNPNPTWGELFLERPKANGACQEWTFTLPWREARQFSWQLEVGTKGPNAHPGDLGGGILSAGDFVFRALDGPHNERFAASTIPFAYVLPETTVSQAGDPVTYRLHTVGTSTVPQSGIWWTYPINCYINPQWSQNGGTTYTFRPNCDGPWVTGWTGTMLGGYMRSQYDPLVDGRAPTVSPPVVRLQAGALGSSVRGSVTWSARDKGSGVHSYQVQLSRNGGPWRAVSLPSIRTTSLTRSFTLGDTFRYRVKARDKVGNWSAWIVGQPIRSTLAQEGSSLVRWTGSWSGVAGAALAGGAARGTSVAGSSARITTTTRGLAWVTRRGPDRGLAQVWVDGVLATTIDLGAASLGGPTVVYARSWTKPGTHTLKIVALGTAGRPLVEVDAFVVAR